MSKLKRKLILILFAGTVFLVVITTALGGSGGYGLDWWAVDGGGGTSSGGPYGLSGTAGQPDLGVLSGGSYTLAGGFWPGGGGTDYHLYLPLTEK
jgi:hypothetical protein